jgi:hypothetical protein
MRQPAVTFISSFNEAPSGRLSRPSTLAALLPSRAPAAGLACLAAFWLLGRRFDELAFFPDLGLPGATRGFRGVTLVRLLAFGGCTVAAEGVLACSSAFDVMVILLIRQMPDSGHPSLRYSSKASETMRQNQRESR